MDTNISWSKKKLRSRSGNNRGNDLGEDRISDLPDCLLEQILSNLDIKAAIKTSLISRRWRHLWTRVPCLKFVFNKRDYIPNWSDHNPLHPRKVRHRDYVCLLLRQRSCLFIPNFVYNVFNRRGACDIDKFEYRCDLVLDPRLLNYMMSRIMRMKVKEVELHVPYVDRMDRRRDQECVIWQLPNCLCANKSLEKLKLRTLHFNPPKIKSFLTLKELRLDGLNNPLRRGKASWPELCASQCPLLESLSFTSCLCRNIDLEISSPMLKHLEILDSRFERVIVSSPLLAYFKFEGINVMDIAVDDRGFLDEVKIVIKVNGEDLKEKLVLFRRRLQKAKSFAIYWKT